jgi:hypothetical protein
MVKKEFALPYLVLIILDSRCDSLNRARFWNVKSLLQLLVVKLTWQNNIAHSTERAAEAVFRASV